VPINAEYYEKRPSLITAFTRPKCGETALEVYMFISENRHYTINRGAGMGMDVSVAPDMIKLAQRAEKRGIDIDRYETYCYEFIKKQSEYEQRKD
jgi:hypothetical protein